MTGWPESDLVLAQQCSSEFIGKNQRFLVYIMTVSGHHNYLFDGNNDIALKNKSLVSELDMEDNAKAYVACNVELDRMLEYLIKELEKSGELDKTVICLSTDHYPYGLTDDEYAHMLGYKKASSMKYDRMERYASTLILWNSAMGTVKVDKPCCTVDVLPTLLNLFGMEYDSRLYSGQDILSDSYGLAMLSNQSFITDKIAYNSRYNKVYYIDKSWKMPDGYLDAYIQIVSNRFSVASSAVNNDFYKYLPQDVIAEAQKK
ncbi:MAG: sulfatase-like hydrolase/transferase [Clostridia bacterium]|nr:sulfatase-like hydrolase/transferase [Clostridia bacterium]